MNDAFGFVAFWLFVLALVFVFTGEPDLWDKLHQRAMQDASCAKDKP